MNASETVTVVVPSYNGSRFIRRTIESVLDQSLTPDKIIVVDDCSSDGSQHVVERYGDPRIMLIQRAKNGGPGAARQTGLDRTKTSLIAFLDQDDQWRPNALANMLSTVQSDKSIVLAYGGIQFFNHGQPAETYVPPAQLTFHDLLAHRLVPSQTMLVRTKALRSVGGPKARVRFTEEWDMCLRLSQIGRLAGTEQVLANVHHHDDNASNDDNAMTTASLETLNLYRRAHGACWACHRSFRATRKMYARKALLHALCLDSSYDRARTLVRLTLAYPDVAMNGLIRRCAISLGADLQMPSGDSTYRAPLKRRRFI